MSVSIDQSESHISAPSSSNRKKSSAVHLHCRTPTEEERNTKPEQKWIWCKYCVYSAQSTTNMKGHLQRTHEITIELSSSIVRTTAGATVQGLYDQLLLKLGNESDLNHEIFRRTVNQEVVTQTLIDLVIVRRLPFSCVEWPELHAFTQALNPTARSFIPTSHNTLKTGIITWFIQAKDIVRKRLQSSQTKIHLAVDIWTSPSHDLLLGVCASFVDAQDSYHNILIGLRVVRGHSGENQWHALLPLLKEYMIERRIGIVIGDNATTNDTLCRTMAQWFTSEQKINWNQAYCRLRCVGHILNLIVQAFLFQTEEEEHFMAMYDQEDQNNDEPDEVQQKERASSIRTKMGVLGKVHNIVVHIRASPQRTAEFTKEAGRTIPLNNRTRWNSWYTMIKVLLQTEVTNVVRNYTARHVTSSTLDKRDELTNQDLTLLRTIKGYLEVFESATLFLQGQQATIERVYEAMDIITIHVNDFLVCRTIESSELLTN